MLSVSAGRRNGRVLATMAALATVAGAVPLLAAAPATAAAPVPQPWTSAAKVTGTNAPTGVQELVTTADGAAVALWNQLPAGSGGKQRRLYAAVRPAGSGTWGAPRQLAVTPTDAGVAKLVTAGSRVVAVWTEFPDSTGPGDEGQTLGRIMSSTLSAGTWSAPASALGPADRRYLSGLDVAAGPDGSVTAVWRERPLAGDTWGITTATRASDGSWSEPVRVDDVGADSTDRVEGGEVAVDARGTAVITFLETNPRWEYRVRTVTRPAGSAGWAKPVTVASHSYTMGLPQVSAGPTGTMAVSWWSENINTGARTIAVASAEDVRAGWGAALPVARAEGLTGTPEPQIGPDGDLTVAWEDWDGDYYTTAASLPAGAAQWSQRVVLSTGKVSGRSEVSTAGDGTVRVLWTQEQADGSGRQLMQAVRTTDDKWSAGAELAGSRADAAHGDIAAGPGGTATAVWTGTTGGASYLWSARASADAPVEVTSSYAPRTADLAGSSSSSTVWDPWWKLNRPVAGWSLTLTDAAGKAIRVRTGSATTQKIAAAWNGRTLGGAPAPNGPLRWRLAAAPVGSATRTVLATGTVTITGGAAVRHDYGSAAGRPDGIGDAVVLTPSGDVRSIFGDGATGRFEGSATGYGWLPGIRPVPIDDMDGDRCDDLLVRSSAGQLRRYTPACGTPVTPRTRNKLIGGGWNQYDVLTSPGDVTGDGAADLVARNPATGALYLYVRTSQGVFAPRVQIPGTYKGYKKIVGAGDLDGDGRGDLVLQDGGNELWRMSGLGRGRFAARVKIADNWGAGYDAVVAPGDMNGDGRADLVARDGHGTVWRYDGTGRGTFGARTKVATGWQGYAGLY
ncbi:VCBS repeat-containing protein [Streptomyces sp. NPDC089919]|uniref:VCBS repeat-containing protein n=1 Tax=Streptomyces sp. NPDC089919 TaxID=3155188 RepID=UPI00344920A1